KALFDDLHQRPRRRRPARDWAPPLLGPGDALDMSSHRTRLAGSPPSPRYARGYFGHLCKNLTDQWMLTSVNSR
ncbi:Os07g0237700, partial [Oryza sativa Japonica Group]